MSEPTVGQIEREISNRIRSMYNNELGLRLSKIVCQFFDKGLAVSLENSVTPIEKVLLSEGYEKLAEEVRLYLDKIMKPQLKNLIEDVIKKPVLDVMSNTTLTTGRTGMIFVLEELPVVRNPQSIPKSC
jgi:uncharacterized protein YbcI